MGNGTLEQYSFDITVTAESEEEAAEKLEAFGRLINIMSHEDLLDSINFIEENPQTIAKVKAWIANPPFGMGAIINSFK